MPEHKNSCVTSGTRLLALVSFLILSGCTTIHSGGDTSGPQIARDPHYKSGNFRPYTVRGKTYYPRVPDEGHTETGTASWYANESPNRTTANGEVFLPDGISAAHKTFPLPSIAEVTNLDNGQTIRLRVNDRGPFVDGRVMDLSRGAAKALGVYTTGTARVRITWLGPAEPIGRVAVYAALEPSGDENRRYIVQLGAFSVRENAEAARDRLADAKIDRRGSLYIVYTGPYTGAATSEGHRQDAIDAGFRGAIMVRAE